MRDYDGDKLSWETPIKHEMKQVEGEILKSVSSEQDLLTDICMHVIGAGGKRIRPGLALLTYKAVGGKDAPNVIGIAASFELIHSATLIHDDINDDGEIRRSRVAAYKKYGVQKALIAGDFLFVRSFRLGGYWIPRVVEIVSDAATAMAEAEIIQGHYERQPDTPYDVYMKIIEGKTAKIMEAAALVGAFLGGADEEQIRSLGGYGLKVGMAFQIIDDTLDINGTEKELGKPKGIDFLDGKPTLPIMLAAKDGSVGARIAELFRQEEKSAIEVEEALSLIMKTSALEESRKVAQEFIVQALRDLDHLKPSIYKDSLRSLAEFVVRRKT